MKSLRTKNTLALTAAVAAALSSLNANASQPAVNTSGTVQQGQSNGGTGDPALNNAAVTISFSGQTALRAFNTTQGITELQPGTTITLHDGTPTYNATLGLTTGGAVNYVAPNNSSSVFVNLASPNLNTADINPGTPSSPSTSDIQTASAVELEWHEQGSVDGLYDLINDEVGFTQGGNTNPQVGATTGQISNESLRTPSSSNPTWINTNKFTSGTTINGYSLDNSSGDNLANTYSTTVYNQATGQNLLGGQNRIQFSAGEYPTEAFSTGTSANASPFATFSASGAAPLGYGQGNPALAQSSTYTGLGVGGVRQSFQSSSIVNESTSVLNPTSGTYNANGTVATADTDYASGPWNTAGANNLSSTAIAATAVTLSANPGTGLLRVNKSDAQWLQTTGRLQNGALFDVVARTVDTGQRIVFALSTGIDPSWAVGSNDDGNSTSSTAATAQHDIGTSFRFDGKTSGTEAAKTIGQGRMALGAISVPEATTLSSVGQTDPVRALDVDFNDTTDPTIGGVTNDNSPNFVEANFNTIVSSDNTTRYQAVLISHYNMVKAPNQTALNAEISDAQTNGSSQQTAVNNELASLYGAGTNLGNATTAQIQQAAWAAVPSFDPTTAETDGTPSTPVSGIQGDPTGDVAAFISNIVNSTRVTGSGTSSASSVNDPADNLYLNGFITPNLLDWTRVADGAPITPVTLSSAALAEQANVNSNYGSLFTTDSSINSNSYASNNETIGNGAYYGALNGSNTGTTITAKDVTVNGSGQIIGWTSAANGDLTAAGGNYLFGNFNQNGVRDYSAVLQSVNAALSLAVADSSVFGTTHDSSMFSGIANTTVIPSLDNSGGTPGWVATQTDTKGDLVTLGDYLGQGTFNGQDLYLLATGASLADSTSSSTLTATATTFADVVRDPNDVLRKNSALDYIQSYLNTSATALAYPAAALFLKQSGAAVLTGSTVPFGATDLHTTDPITGLEQFTYDPNGNNSFNPADVNRDGVIDFNDAVLVDQYNGQSYSNLTQSLAATQQTPVTGATEALSLVAVQQVDGEAAIGAADLASINSQLTGTGNTNWYGYTLTKSGPGTIVWGRTGGTVTVYSGAQFDINSGAVVVDGTVDPFTDNNAAGPGSTAGNHLKVVNNASLTVEGAADNVVLNGITGTGTLTVGDGTNASSVQLLANSGGSAQNALVINGASKLDITNNHFTVADIGGPHDATFANIVGWVANGVNGTPGGVITSSAALPGYGVGVVDGNDGVLGTTVSSGTIEVAYTLEGDANLDGKVDITDFNIFAPNFGLPTTLGWEAGDFNYSGTVDIGDFNLFAGNFGLSDNGTDVPIPAADVTAIEAFATANGISVTLNNVPEPGSLTLLALAGAGTLARRRRKS